MNVTCFYLLTEWISILVNLQLECPHKFHYTCVKLTAAHIKNVAIPKLVPTLKEKISTVFIFFISLAMRCKCLFSLTVFFLYPSHTTMFCRKVAKRKSRGESLGKTYRNWSRTSRRCRWKNWRTRWRKTERKRRRQERKSGNRLPETGQGTLGIPRPFLWK